MKTVAAFIFTIAALLFWVYGHSCVAFALELSDAEQIHATNIWMLCDAMAKSFTMLSLVLITTGYYREWVCFMFALSVNNVMDEVFFSPTAIGLNEYVILIALIIYYTFKITKNYYANPR